MNIAVTGADGFVGQAVVRQLAANGNQVLAYVRRSGAFAPMAGVTLMAAPDLGQHADWLLQPEHGIHALVHTAARVHTIQDTSTDPLAEFRQANVEGTVSLARQAAYAGVKRFVFLSSIKVNGEFTEVGTPFTADDEPAPQDPYGISKHEAEQLLCEISDNTGMEVVIIRPPLVYGPGVKANFKSMMYWLARGVPLPLAAVTENRRSLVALDNLVDLIVKCLTHPAAANQTFLVSDGEDLSTADLLKRMGVVSGHSARLFPIPLSMLKLCAAMVNKSGIYQRLCRSLQLDISKTRQMLTWDPPISVDEGLRRAAEKFRE
jgi:nucleoside-diphosphate-sugar epimerase